MNDREEVAEAVKSTPWTWRSLVAFAISLAAMNPVGALAVGMALATPLLVLVLVIGAAREAPHDVVMKQCTDMCHGHVARFSSEFGGETICECR